MDEEWLVFLSSLSWASARDANLWAPSVQGSSGLSQCRAFVDLLSRELGQDNEAQ